MGLTFSGKTPMAVRAKASRTKTRAPILPKRFPLRNINKPVAKRMARTPPIMRPALNKTAMTPSWTPRSLSAFSVQLKLGEYTITSSSNVKTTMGATIPQMPDTFSQTIAIPFTLRT